MVRLDIFSSVLLIVLFGYIQDHSFDIYIYTVYNV